MSPPPASPNERRSTSHWPSRVSKIWPKPKDECKSVSPTPVPSARRVVLPAALPDLFAGLRVALALSFIVMFAAEMINARSGLGHLIRDSEASLRFDLMYVALVSIALLGYAGDRLLRFARSRALAWQDT